MLQAKSFILIAIDIGLICILWTQQDKCYIMFSTTFNHCMNEKWYTLKGQNLENGLSYIFQIIGNILNLCVCAKSIQSCLTL